MCTRRTPFGNKRNTLSADAAGGSPRTSLPEKGQSGRHVRVAQTNPGGAGRPAATGWRAWVCAEGRLRDGASGNAG